MRNLRTYIIHTRKTVANRLHSRKKRGTQYMGFTMETLKAYNSEDILRASRGEIDPDNVRRVSVPALVDTGAYWSGLHQSEIEILGLSEYVEIPVGTGNGVATFKRYTPGPMLELQGRRTNMDILELPDHMPAIIGVGLLESLVFIVDPISQRVIPDPAHGGRQEYWMFRMGA
jgi:predicted aspartyl protease